MWCAIYFVIVQQLLYSTSMVESLTGSKVMSARNGEFPFIASLQYYPGGQHFCSSAVLITRKHVITGAHCLNKLTPAEIRIALGLVDLQNVAANYAVASWLTYDHWADGLNIQKPPFRLHDIAIVKLLSEVNQPNVKPVVLSELNKQQIQKTKAIVLGWSENAEAKKLQKATVNILSDEDCRGKIRLVTIVSWNTDNRTLCSFADPYVLLDKGDNGGPLVDDHHALLAINTRYGPEKEYAWGDFSEDFLKKYQINIHYNIDYYRRFIVNATTYF